MILDYDTWQVEWTNFTQRPLCPWVHIEQKAGWIPEPLFTLCGKIILLSLLQRN